MYIPRNFVTALTALSPRIQNAPAKAVTFQADLPQIVILPKMALSPSAATQRRAMVKSRSRSLPDVRPFDSEKKECARATGTAYIQVARRDWDYDYKCPNRRDEVGTAYGRVPLSVERDNKTGFFNIQPLS